MYCKKHQRKGVLRKRVADVKTIGLGTASFYHGGAEGMRAVERRSQRIQTEYEAGARRGDELAGAVAGTRKGQPEAV